MTQLLHQAIKQLAEENDDHAINLILRKKDLNALDNLVGDNPIIKSIEKTRIHFKTLDVSIFEMKISKKNTIIKPGIVIVHIYDCGDVLGYYHMKITENLMNELSDAMNKLLGISTNKFTYKIGIRTEPFKLEEWEEIKSTILKTIKNLGYEIDLEYKLN